MINITIHLLEFNLLLVKCCSSTTKTTALHWMVSSHIVRESNFRMYSQFKQMRSRKEDYNPCFIARDLMHRDQPPSLGQSVHRNGGGQGSNQQHLSLQAGNNISPVHHPCPKALAAKLTEEDWKMVVNSNLRGDSFCASVELCNFAIFCTEKVPILFVHLLQAFQNGDFQRKLTQRQ